MKNLIYLFIFVIFLLPKTTLAYNNNLDYSNIRDVALSSMVKINVFSNDSGFFKKINNVFGVVLTQNGKIMTNTEGLNQNSYNNVFYQVCTNDYANEQSNFSLCEYTADYIGDISELGVSFLKINTNHKENHRFDYINLVSDETVIKEKDKVVVVGTYRNDLEKIQAKFGFINKADDEVNHDNDYYQLTTLKSFTNFYIIVNDNKELIGAKSKKILNKKRRYDFFNLRKLKDSINEFLIGYEINDSVDDDFINFLTKKEKIENNLDVFNFEPVGLNISKPVFWNFIYEDENELLIDYLADNNSGWVKFRFHNFPYVLDFNNVLKSYESYYIKNNQKIEIIEQRSMDLNDQSILSLKAKIDNDDFKIKLMIFDNYLIEILYDYGIDENNKVDVERLFDKIFIDRNDPYFFNSDYVYNNDKYGFNIGGIKDWVLEKNYNDNQAVFVNKINNNIKFSINFSVMEEGIKELPNNILLDLVVGSNNDYSEVSKLEKSGHRVRIIDNILEYSVNDDIKNVFYIDYIVTKDGRNSYIRDYYLKNENTLIKMRFHLFSNDKNEFNESIEMLSELLKSIHLKESIDDSSINESVIENKDDNQGSTGIISDNIEKKEVKPVVKIEKLLKYSGKTDKLLLKRLRGKIVLQVEDKGKAWYIDPGKDKRVFLGKPKTAYDLIREKAIGIKNIDLEKIPLGYINTNGFDSDRDGLVDEFEKAIGTDINKKDTDNDGYSDYVEVFNSYSPVKSNAKYSYSQKLIERFEGKFLLQVEGKGEAWYISPNDGKRYFLGNPKAALAVMSQLGLGITDQNLANIPN